MSINLETLKDPKVYYEDKLVGEVNRASDSIIAIENALGSYETVQALLNVREEVGGE
jgi:hypothetical protein